MASSHLKMGHTTSTRCYRDVYRGESEFAFALLSDGLLDDISGDADRVERSFAAARHRLTGYFINQPTAGYKCRRRASRPIMNDVTAMAPEHEARWGADGIAATFRCWRAAISSAGEVRSGGGRR